MTMSMDSSDVESPQRLSALYQYHNAPEVAPAHGLEYDDTPYPSSDKYPVIHSAAYDSTKYTGKHAAFLQDNRPPRIIFGMKVRTFLMVAAVMVFIVVGAAVGGAVGGKQMRQSSTQDGTIAYAVNTTSTNATQTATASASSISSYNAPTPTFSPLSDCPNSNNTLYTSSFASGHSGTVPKGASNALNFTKYCGVESPLNGNNAETISEAFVYSFSDCVEVCAAYNFWSNAANCTVAVYDSQGGRPGNCWLGYAQTTYAKLEPKQGVAVALLVQDL